MPLFLHLVLGLCLMLTPAVSIAVTNQSKVPVFNYHPRVLQPPCDYTGSDLRMLETDLQTLHDEGFRVVPLYWITQWLRGEKDGSELPPWIVGITLDDAFEADWRDDVFAGVNPPHPCPAGYGKSAYSILRAYWDKYKDILPPGSPHASSFVIASPAARTAIDDFNVPPQFGGPGNQSHRDYWWAAAQNSGFMEVYNHSADHDDMTIQGGASPVVDYDFLENGQPVNLPIGGPDGNGLWNGMFDFTRIDNYSEATLQVVEAARFIERRIGVYPDLFAYPLGRYSEYLRTVYFPNFQHEHKTKAAWGTFRVSDEQTYVRRGGDIWNLGRFGARERWNSTAQFKALLRGSLRTDELTIGHFYLGVLKRVGDGPGYSYWVGEVRGVGCNATTGSLVSKLDFISGFFWNSPEFMGMGGGQHDIYVDALYRGILRREPDAEGRNYWIGQLQQGASREYVRSWFFNSPEFLNESINPIQAELCSAP